MERERLVAFGSGNFMDRVANLCACGFGRKWAYACAIRWTRIENSEDRGGSERSFEKAKSRPPGRLS